MQLSSDTISVLQNFASINPNVVLKPGQETKNILAEADIIEDFPQEIGIYDLFEFLSVHNLVESPHLEFESNAIVIQSTGGGCKLPNKQTVKYYSAEPSILTTTDKNIDMPDPEVTMNLTSDVISRIKKAASVLGHTDISINENPGGNTFSFVINISNLKLIDGDYDVFISAKGNVFVSKWVNTTIPVRYFIALEQS